ncbi:MAG: 23S rRNA (adenine(2503)-C(2))-methyltransferase RlmN [Acidobacteria bacterium]|nr:23S rRNA (adenine(2503)-C(2))-methyltransferase RlmN [Acidobacteriota bacterium]MBU4307424.1 23S rRNA (adenine(2503)-C(2))-methyltransferase RlmN [Acidobacteriota bacterium]MBU4404056.1 23S rRNA (adenine(2503)-C(2))-methyltransferase RlmN [Acidobacteriota bacterium]MCG2811226.1 23S rRNA (adenine(2503)-C(2))-methyltransferase RlmN [Candidatus Aminicenantes bacterium]
MKSWILERQLDELKEELLSAGFRVFTARQVFQWLYHKNTQDIAAWSNIGKVDRERIAELYECECRPVLESRSDDQGTRKFLIGLADGLQIEAVLIREKDHYTFCLSTQVGCALDCAFCATGSMGFRRNLSSGEILTQVLTLKKELGDYSGKLNLVFMGMGEPLLNYENLARVLRTISEPDGLNISPRHVTVSTAGILEHLKKLERDFPQVRIAFSLNAPTAGLRAELMPVSRRENLDDLLAHFRGHKRRRRLTCEYVLLGGVNDSPAQARQLVRLLHGIPAKVNLIPYNENPALPFRRPDETAVEKFRAVLQEKGLTVITRWSKGQGIRSACGQLAVFAANP